MVRQWLAPVVGLADPSPVVAAADPPSLDLAEPAATSAGSRLYAVTAHDFDEDGIVDVAVTSYEANEVHTLKGVGDGSLAATTLLASVPTPSLLRTASNLNYAAGTTIPNAVITKIGVDGKVCLLASQTLHLVVDVNGAFPPTTSYKPLTPARLIETRPGQTTVDGQQQIGGTVSPGSVTAVQVTGRAGVPAGATAAVLNVTITEPQAAGYATVFPCATEPPTASNLNYSPGLTIPNLAISNTRDRGPVRTQRRSVVARSRRDSLWGLRTA